MASPEKSGETFHKSGPAGTKTNDCTGEDICCIQTASFGAAEPLPAGGERWNGAGSLASIA